MLRTILGVVAGVLTWMLVAIVCGLILRASWPEYAAVEETMSFTLPMLLVRLSISTVALLIAGWMAALVARSERGPLILGIVLLLIFIPIHVNLWDRFPVWYHLLFLLTLVPLSILGGRIRRRTTRADHMAASTG
jgi:hypothetical protein